MVGLMGERREKNTAVIDAAENGAVQLALTRGDGLQRSAVGPADPPETPIQKHAKTLEPKTGDFSGLTGVPGACFLV